MFFYQISVKTSFTTRYNVVYIGAKVKFCVNVVHLEQMHEAVFRQ